MGSAASSPQLAPAPPTAIAPAAAMRRSTDDDGFSTANDSEFIVDPQPILPPVIPSGPKYNRPLPPLPGKVAAAAVMPSPPKRSFFNQQNANTAGSLVLSTGVLASTIIALIAMAEVKKNPTSKLKGWATGINVVLSTILLLVTANIGYGIFRAVQRNRTPK